MLLENDTGGDPMTGLKWTRRTTDKVAVLLSKLRIFVSSSTVGRLLHQMGYSLRVNHKMLATDSSPDRNQQFEYIAELRASFQRRSHPIISVDTKKRELVGNFNNPGTQWCRSPILVNDHDFRTDSIGIAIPYGIYDLLANRGSIFLGISHDTACFAARSIARWWSREGLFRYPRTSKLLILADTGGSNSSRTYAWKTEIQKQLCNRFNLTVTIAHYPTGASKWNPVEHRLFSEISKNWVGEPLTTYEKILKFIRTTNTQTGLRVTAYMDHTTYETGLTPTTEDRHQLCIRPHDILPKWNYTIRPNPRAS
jgi:hypothetical protein